jgi:renalase
LTRTVSNPLTKPYFDNLAEQGLIRQFPTRDIPGFKQNQDKENYVCTSGTASVVKHFLTQSQVKNIVFNRRVVSIKVTEDGRVEVVPEEQNQSELFDIVISTMPVPQILQLENIDGILGKSEELKKKLSEVSYTSRYALGLFYNEQLTVRSPEAAVNFVDDNPVVRYWTLEDEKRRLGNPDAPRESSSAVVIHTSVEFGAENIDKQLEDMKELLLAEIKGKFKTLEGKDPEYVKCQKWRYSQVKKGYEGSPGYAVLSEIPLILAAGDGFVQSGFENCVLSAENTAQRLISGTN